MSIDLFQKAKQGDPKSIARCISLIEHDAAASFMEELVENPNIPVIGITGPPGAGKSTLVDQLIKSYIEHGFRTAVVCVDPSSPFTHGAILGDRIRMEKWSGNNNVFIRSLSNKGDYGGLHPKTIEICSLLKNCGFDLILLETVGVGQAEIEIASHSNLVLLVLVPEAGDEIQFMKSGIMEGADIFVVNKSDRPNALQFAAELKLSLHENGLSDPKVLNTVAQTGDGINQLFTTINATLSKQKTLEALSANLAKKAFQLISEKKMKNIQVEMLEKDILLTLQKGDLHLHKFIQKYI